MNETSLPRLRGMAQHLLFDQLRSKDHIHPLNVHPDMIRPVTEPRELFKYMLLSTSTLLIVRRYLYGATVYRTHYGFCVEIRSKKGPIRHARLSLPLVCAWMGLARPQLISLLVNSKFDLEPMSRLAPYLSGLICLSAFSDPKLIPLLKQLQQNVTQLDCSMETLLLGKFPSLKLERLKLRPLGHEQKIKMSRILRHEVKQLEMTVTNPFALHKSRLKKRFSDKKSLELLRLNLCNVNLVHDLLPFLQHLRLMAPKLQRLELVIEATTEMLFGTPFGTVFDNQLLQFYASIEDFREQTAPLLKRLYIYFNGQITMSTEDLLRSLTNPWITQLRESPKLQQAKFTLQQISKIDILHAEERDFFMGLGLEEEDKLELIEQISLKRNDGFLELDFCVNFEYILEERKSRRPVGGPMIYAFSIDYDDF